MTPPLLTPLPSSSPSLAQIKSHHSPPRLSFLPRSLQPSKTYLNPWHSDRSPLNPTTLANAFADPAEPPHADDLRFEKESGWADQAEKAELGREEEPERTRERLDFEQTGDDGGRVRGMWIGHASFWFEFRGGGVKAKGEERMGVLLDPVFEKRCSPSDRFGPVRDVAPPCSVDDLPPIHLVLISHDHYDHLSQSTSLALYNSPTHSSTVRWLVPLGIKAFFTETLKIAEDRVTEMDWWEEVLVELPLLSSSSSSPSSSSTELERGEAGEGKENSEAGRSGVRLRVACTPSQHGSGRGLGEKDHSLWCSWALGLEKGGARQRNSLTTAVKHPSSDPASPPAASKLHSLNAEEDSLHHERERDEAVLSHPVRAIRDQPEYFLATAAEIKATHPVWVREMDWKCFFAGDTGYRLFGTDPTDEKSTCPAFKQIATLYFPASKSPPPTLLLLPLSPGSSLPYLKSVLPSLPSLPSSIASLPCIRSLRRKLPRFTDPNMAILTSQVHMTPVDAVQVFELFGGRAGTAAATGEEESSSSRERESLGGEISAVGIHWGTWGGPQMATSNRRWLWKEMRLRGIAKTGPGAFELWKVGQIRDLAWFT